MNDYINVPSININNQTFSISAWINRKALSTNAEGIWGGWNYSSNISQQSGLVLRYYMNSNTLYFDTVITNSTNKTLLAIASSTSDNLNQWYNVMATFSIPNMQIILYINGVSVGSSSIPSSYNSLVPPTYNFIGYDTTNSGFFNGSIDEVAIWNRSLSATEVASLYNSQAAYFNLSTDSTGYTPQSLLTDYFSTNGTPIYLSNYTISAKKSG